MWNLSGAFKQFLYHWAKLVMPEIYKFILDINNWGLKVTTLIKVNISGRYLDQRVQGRKHHEFITEFESIEV